MANFLNTIDFVEAIKCILKEAEKEVIMIVPYIKVSPAIWSELVAAEQRGIQILIVYREDSMNTHEKSRLTSLSNITLLYNEHVHAKCYLNENSMIIGSMNLYEYSEQNNREMGVLLDKENEDGRAYSLALEEVKSIYSTSDFDHKSYVLQKQHYKFDLLKDDEIRFRPLLDYLNDLFENKKFVLKKNAGSEPSIIVEEYYEKLKVELDYLYDISNPKYSIGHFYPKRFVIRSEMELDKLKGIHELFWDKFDESLLHKFQVYWESEYNAITLYPQKNHSIWTSASAEDAIIVLKDGLDYVTNLFQLSSKQVRSKTKKSFN